MHALVIAAVVFAFAAPQVSSYSMYAMRVPNGDKVPGVTALGHVDPVLAGPMNEFGMDMIAADFHWTKEFCMKDSDGDGQTNGKELGDPCCAFVYKKNPKVRWTEGISHPGDATLMSDPKLWETIVCEEAADANTSRNAEETEISEKTQDTTMQGETATEDIEEPIKVSSQKTKGANDTAVEAATVSNEVAAALLALSSSSLLSVVGVLGLLAFVVARWRRRRSHWTLLPQQSRRAQ
ncbi:hypothetical protein PHMEG_00012542 [Phytophthora megakarya]|uniref:Temptin Cys/Cys disulfide domain-containing protein n=1 Tax=Phytophthora megakarya TaxID=4795 RepID=A0A225WA72_9STRA|nr:hypothetical protein PHMEG_00012542 [Phytophthora megakarya]